MSKDVKKVETKKVETKDYYRMKDVYFSEGRKALTRNAIERNYQNSLKGYKFITLSKDNLGDNFTLYKIAVDEYHKSLYQSKQTKFKDERLVNILVILSLPNEEIEGIVKANIHSDIIKNTARFKQSLNDLGKEGKKAREENIEILRNKLDTLEKSEEILQCKEEIIKACNELDEFLKTDIYEKATIESVSEGTFRKYFEMYLGGYLASKESILKEYESLNDKILNRKWSRLYTKALEKGVDKETFNKYASANDSEGLKSYMRNLQKVKLTK